MFCRYCGEKNPPGREICVSCGAPLIPQIKREVHRPDVPSYLGPALILTFLFFQPCGVIAIIYSLKVLSHLKNGYYEDAKRASEDAKRWCWISFFVTIALIVIFILIYIFFGLALLGIILGSIGIILKAIF